MSVYRTILEEDLELGGVLDDNNCVELQEIEDVIENQDANAFEQDEARDAEFGTSYGDDTIDDAEAIVDESFIAIAESEVNFNKLMMAVGIHEVTEAAAGREIIYEAVDIKGYLKRAKDAVVSFFKKVWQVLQRFAANIASTFRTNKGFAEKYGDKITSGYKIYSKDGKKLKMYSYEGLDRVADAKFWTNGIDTVNFEPVSGYMDAIKNWHDTSYTQAELSTEYFDRVVREYREKLCGTACEAGEFREKLRIKICGSEEKKEGYMDPELVKKVLSNGKEIKDCKKAIDGAKKEYKSAIKKLDQLEKSLSKKKSEKDASNETKTQFTNVVRMSNMFQNILTACQVSRATILSAMRSRMSQARMFGQAYVFAQNKKDKKGFQKESAEYGFLSNMDLV